VIVVDDGSPDETSEIVTAYAARDPRVRLLRQTNEGLSGARNAGLAQALGDYVVFLDADDVLLPHALTKGVEALRAHPEAAFASGRFEFMGYELEPLETPPDIGCIIGDPYTALLRVNQIAVPAMVMYNRWIFSLVSTFDASVTPAEDYDLYLRITRRHPICTHDSVVARYRQYGAGLSSNSAMMGHALIRIMDRQRLHIAGNAARERACRAGVRFWQQLYYTRAARTALARALVNGDWSELFKELPVVLRWGPLAIVRYLRERVGRFRRRLWRGSRREVLA